MKKFFIIVVLVVAGLFMFSCVEEYSPEGIQEPQSLEIPIEELETKDGDYEDEGGDPRVNL